MERTEKMRSITRLLLVFLAVSLLAACAKSEKKDVHITQGDTETDNSNIVSTEKNVTVPKLVGQSFDSTLQQQLMNDGYILSVKTEYHDTVPQGYIISQIPSGGEKASGNGAALELCISAGKRGGTQLEASENIQKNDDESEQQKPRQEKTDSKSQLSEQPPKSITASSEVGLTVPQWIIQPTIDYDILETFGMTGYSICRKWNSYGIIDINGKPYGTGDYTKLFYCSEHGLSSPDVKAPTSVADDLVISPDCGYKVKNDNNIYVFDNTRNKVYLTGYSDEKFRIADITDTEFFKTNSSYIAVLYDCDADLMMYEGIGMESLSEIFKAENRKMHYGVVNNEFYTLVEFVYDSVREGNDCFIVEKNGKYGYRGLSGQYYYECIFEEANTAYFGAAWVKYGGKWGTVSF